MTPAERKEIRAAATRMKRDIATLAPIHKRLAKGIDITMDRRKWNKWTRTPRGKAAIRREENLSLALAEMAHAVKSLREAAR